MKKKWAKAQYQSGNKKVNINVTLFSWIEDGIYFLYSPSLDLTGYGNSKEEAKESFGTTLDEFVKYTENKRTIYDELEKLGWAVNKRKKKVVAPEFEEMLSENDHFNSIYKKRNWEQESSNVGLVLA